jgi:hypothetical protein
MPARVKSFHSLIRLPFPFQSLAFSFNQTLDVPASFGYLRGFRMAPEVGA